MNLPMLLYMWAIWHGTAYHNTYFIITSLDITRSLMRQKIILEQIEGDKLS